MRSKFEISKKMLVFAMLIVFLGAFVICSDYTYAASKTHLKKNTVTITVGETYQQKLIDVNGKVIKASNVKWSTNKKGVAKISKSGKVSAVKVGTAILNAKYKGKVYKFKVTVKKPQFASSKIILTTGETYKQKLYNANKKLIGTKNIQYKSGNKKVASINGNGLITSKKTGTATITAKYKGKVYTFKVVVKDTYFKKKNILMTAGEEIPFPKLYNAKGKAISTNMIAYDTYNQNVALVWDDSIIAKKAGTTTLTAQYIYNKSKCTITVKNATFKTKHIKLKVGNTYQQVLYGANKNKINPSKLKFVNYDEGIVTINSKGLIKGKSSGETEVTVRYNEVEYTFRITVSSNDRLEEVTKPEEQTKPDVDVSEKTPYLKNTSISIYAGESYQQQLYDSKGKIITDGVTYKIVDKTIATVDSKGNITSLKAGKTVLITSHNGKEYYSDINVNSRFLLSEKEVFINDETPTVLYLEENVYSSTYYYEMSDTGYTSFEWGTWNEANDILSIILSAKNSGDITLSIWCNAAPYDKQTVLIHNSLQTVDKWYVVCSNAIPFTSYHYAVSGKLVTMAEIDSVSIKTNDYTYYNAEVEITGIIKYCKSGWTSPHFAYYKIIDEEGYVVGTGSVMTNTYTVGERFKVKDSFTVDDPKGKYTIQFYNE